MTVIVDMNINPLNQLSVIADKRAAVYSLSKIHVRNG